MLIKAANVCRKPDLRALGRASARRPRQEDIPSPGHEPQASWVIKMFSVIFEVHPKKEQFDLYLALAKDLRPILQGIDGFVDNERFESARRPGWILSHSTWRDEKSVVRWRTVAKHHENSTARPRRRLSRLSFAGWRSRVGYGASRWRTFG
jgi:heme-degrading monooxygenase HmoA